MRTRLLIASLIAILSVSCIQKAEDKPLETTKDTTDLAVVPVSVVKECYEFVQQKDTISLRYEQDGAKVTGHLAFKNYEKDSSHGPVEGTFSGDTLKLSYSFASEGMQSVRDIYFLKSGKTLLMGIGDMTEKDSKQIYTQPKSIRYDPKLVLAKSVCED